METNEKLVAQLHRMADMLLPFAAGLAGGEDFDSAAGFCMADAAARQWYGMLTVAAAMVERQSCALSESQLLYLQRTFVGGAGSFQDFRLNGEQVWANKKLDMERQALLDLLADCHSETAQASKESA